MKQPVKAVLLGIGTGILGLIVCLFPFALELEENAGLDWLFNVRGTRTPPPDIVVISIDKVSADALGIHAEAIKWPRTYHADLIKRLAEAGAAVIVLDIFFKEPRDQRGDARLARAIDEAGNVILFEYTKKEITRMFDAAGNTTGEMLTQRLVLPVAQFADAALALAPFPLPVFPVKVSQFWTFNPGTGNLPTMPVVALQLYASTVYTDLLEQVKRIAPVDFPPLTKTGNDLHRKQAAPQTIRMLRAVFSKRSALAERMLDALSTEPQDRHSDEQRILLRSLIQMYSGPDSRYLNYYGPPRTITTVPYIEVLQPDRPVLHAQPSVDLRGKVVFVGYSERLQPERLDEFYTVFSGKNGVHLSGVEISATAFANLLENRSVIPLTLPVQWLLLFGWGILVGMTLRLLPVFPAVATAFGLAGLYLFISQLMFNEFTIWLPLIVPLFVQVPLALFAAILWHHLEVNRERESIRTAFGLYLPPPVVDRLANDLADGRTESQLVYGTCLSTDAGQYTSYSESVDPETLGKLMNAYYETLFPPVRKYGGTVSDIIGDSMLAIWPSSTPDPEMRHNAIRAAIEIDTAMQSLGQQQAAHHLPTRIGLHTGKIMIGSIGAIDHYEYRPVGDIVNTASRIEGLNKHLGTRMLVSSDTLDGFEGALTREIGTFILAGKTQPLVIHELIGRHSNNIDPEWIQSQSVFVDGLASFCQGDWFSAEAAFSRLVTEHNDSVARFYLNHCRHRQPDPDWDGVICMDTK